MLKKVKLINILEQNQKNKDFYIYISCLILLITFLQIFSGIIRYTQLNKFISEQENKSNNSSSQNLKTADTLQFNIIFDEMKEVCAIIGTENLETLILQNNNIKIKGSCENISNLEKLIERKKVKSFNIYTLEEKEGRHIFDAEYSLN